MLHSLRTSFQQTGSTCRSIVSLASDVAIIYHYSLASITDKMAGPNIHLYTETVAINVFL